MSGKSSSARGYGSRWQKAREAYLIKHPVCAMHLKFGKVVKATVVDHITPHRLDEALKSGDSLKIKIALELFWDKNNWQPLCKKCHDSHKKRLEMSGRVVGCDVNGIPIDANHHWHQGKTDT